MASDPATAARQAESAACVDGRRVLIGIFPGAAPETTVARPAQTLCTLKPLRALATLGHVGPVDGCDHNGLRRRHTDDRQHFHAGALVDC